MKKNDPKQRHRRCFMLRKILNIMKLTTLLFFLALLQVTATSTYSQTQKMNLSFQNKTLSEVFAVIEQNSDCSFFYKNELLKDTKLKSGHYENAMVSEILDDVLKDENLTYTSKGKLVMIVSREEVATEISVQQQKTVSGKVADSSGQPLPGVTVVVKGTTNGTITDANGNYSLSNIPENALLQFSFVGMKGQEIVVNNQGQINVQLLADMKDLDEVVVVGYGSQKRSDVIGSVSQVSAEKINHRTTPQLSQALTGQFAGVTVVQRSGLPGAPGGSIQIRGVGSFGAGTAPLILVDGIPAGSMNDIDPNDVENISILKDASSAAIYGSRAANGVILITTKSGESEDVNISYNAHFGVQRPTKFPKFVNSWEYAELLNEATGGGAGSYTSEEIQKFKDGSDPDNYPNVDYIDEVFKDNSIQTAHNITVSQNKGNIQYLVSVGSMYQNGIIDENSYNRNNLRVNLTTKLASNITLATKFSAIQVIDHQPHTPGSVPGNASGTLGIIGWTLRYPGIYPTVLSNGDFGLGLAGVGTPISLLASDGFYKNRSTDLNGNIRLDWNIVENLKFSLIGGYTQLNGRDDTFQSTQRLNANVFIGPSSLSVSTRYNTYKTLQQLLEYGKTIGEHHFDVLTAHSFEAFYNENLGASRLDFPSNDITVINAGSADGQTNSGNASEYALDSYFGRVKYNYANRYLLEGVLRYDGSSRFPTDNKYAFFPSVAVGWRISEEKFLKDRFLFLDDLKLKASYGVLGNQDIGNYPYQEVLNSGYNYGFGNSVNTGVANTTLVDPSIHWESTRIYDVGFDARLFGGKMNLGMTYYDRYTYDILVSPNASVSNVLGFGIGEMNSGSMENKGWEFTLDHRNKIGDFEYFLAANFAIVNNKVLDLGIANVTQPNGMIGNGSSLFIGYPLQNYYGYVSDGLYIDVPDVENYNTISNQSAVNPNPQPGDIKYKDISGPDGVPDGKVDAAYDRKILGSTIPKYSYGLNLGTNYKGFSLNALIQAVSGAQGRLNNNAGYAFFFDDGNVQRWQMNERWTEENPNPNAKYPRLELIPNTGTPNTVLSNYWVLDASYIKLRYVELGYELPGSITKKLRMKNLRFNIRAENLLTISGYREGWDPEVNAGLKDYYPILKNFTFGIVANF